MSRIVALSKGWINLDHVVEGRIEGPGPDAVTYYVREGGERTANGPDAVKIWRRVQAIDAHGEPRAASDPGEPSEPEGDSRRPLRVEILPVGDPPGVGSTDPRARRGG